MAFSLKNLGLGSKENMDSPMTVAEGPSSDAPAKSGSSLLPAFFAQQPVIQQMKTLGELAERVPTIPRGQGGG